MRPVNDSALASRLIDEGARLLAEEGSAGLSLRKVAAAAGTSTMAIYSLFGDKQRLLTAMLREGFRRLGERLRAEATPDTATPDTATADPAAALVELARAYRLAALESPHLYALMFGPRPLELQPSEADDKAADATYAVLVDNVRMAVERKILTGDPERIALQFWVVAHGMVSLELAGHLPFPPEQAARAYDAALLCAAQPFLVPQ